MIYDGQGEQLDYPFSGSGAELSVAYDKDGNTIYNGDTPAVDYDNYTLDSSFSLSVTNCQGIAVHNSVLFQFRANGSSVSNLVSLFNLADKSAIKSNMTIDSGHGDSATFSDEYQAAGDEFPLLYVTADTTPAIIYVDKVTRNEATLVRTLKFPATAGYWGAGAFDFENDICYILAYKIENYTSASGGNATVISKWNLASLTDNGDGTYTPAFVDQYEADFIYTMQGLAYHDGMIWVSSGGNGTAQRIYALDPADGSVLHTIILSDTTEIEGIQFIWDEAGHAYYLLVAQQGGKYKKYIFGTL